MKSLKEKFQDYKKKKSIWAKITDIIFVLFIIALIIPQSRMAVGGFINRAKSMIINPSVEKENVRTLSVEEMNWPVEDLNGNKENLADLRGKVVFLNIWATWCPPCVGEMPGIQELYDKFKDNDKIAFVLVSDEDPNKIHSFISKKGYSFPVYTTRFQSPDAFLTNSIPATYVISKKGEIVINEKGAQNWGGKKMQKIIQELLDD